LIDVNSIVPPEEEGIFHLGNEMRVERVLGEPTLEVHVVEVCLVCGVDSLVVILRIIVTHARDDKGVRESLSET
jgi:hypothetical protein